MDAATLGDFPSNGGAGQFPQIRSQTDLSDPASSNRHRPLGPGREASPEQNGSWGETAGLGRGRWAPPRVPTAGRAQKGLSKAPGLKNRGGKLSTEYEKGGYLREWISLYRTPHVFPNRDVQTAHSAPFQKILQGTTGRQTPGLVTARAPHKGGAPRKGFRSEVRGGVLLPAQHALGAACVMSGSHSVTHSVF